MTKLTPVQLNDGTVIFIEATEEVDAPLVSTEEPAGEERLIDKGGNVNRMVQNFQVIESTIRAYTNYTLNAFREVANANINKVTLEFGIKVAGEAGVPYITKGTAESNLKITVECSFPEKEL